MPRTDPETGFVVDDARKDPFARTTEDPVEDFRMPLLQHLVELRRRLIICVSAISIGMAVTYFYAEPIWNVLAAPMNEALVAHNGRLIQLDPLEGFMNQLMVAALSGLMIASPLVSYQVWKFVAPGLYPKEQRVIVPLAMASSFLFLAGVAFGYFGIFTYAFPFFLDITYQGIEATIPINTYLALATKLLLAFGVCFQLPIVIYFLARLGIINHRDMISGFRYSIVGIFVVAAVLTPPDVLSQIIMAVPLTVLYGVGIIVAWVFSTKPVSTPGAPG